MTETLMKYRNLIRDKSNPLSEYKRQSVQYTLEDTSSIDLPRYGCAIADGYVMKLHIGLTSYVKEILVDEHKHSVKQIFRSWGHCDSLLGAEHQFQ